MLRGCGRGGGFRLAAMPSAMLTPPCCGAPCLSQALAMQLAMMGAASADAAAKKKKKPKKKRRNRRRNKNGAKAEEERAPAVCGLANMPVVQIGGGEAAPAKCPLSAMPVVQIGNNTPSA